MPKNLLQRFWDRVNKIAGASSCWVWTGARNGNYGIIGVRGKLVLVHRFSYSIHHGEIQPGAMICHRCDNPLCVRPEHLYAGTAESNARDRVMRDRQVSRRGPCHYSAKLTWADVASIRRKHSTGVDASELATGYGVSERTIYSIVHNLTWTQAERARTTRGH